jgi:hypothetical protein
MSRFFAPLTQSPGEPLGDDAADSRGREKGVYVHVGEARQGTSGVVCMERSENHVSGEGSLDEELRCLAISDLTHQYDVWITAQDMPQT